jgi:hypothetical protein
MTLPPTIFTIEETPPAALIVVNADVRTGGTVSAGAAARHPVVTGAAQKSFEKARRL